MSDQAKAEFAVRAWLETENIESALDQHTCDVEKATSEFYSFSSSTIRKEESTELFLFFTSLPWSRVFVQVSARMGKVPFSNRELIFRLTLFVVPRTSYHLSSLHVSRTRTCTCFFPSCACA